MEFRVIPAPDLAKLSIPIGFSPKGFRVIPAPVYLPSPFDRGFAKAGLNSIVTVYWVLLVTLTEFYTP